MAAFDYTSIQSDAADLILQFGRLATIKMQKTGPDVLAPWKPGTQTEDVATVTAVFIKYQEKYVNGDSIHLGDQYALVAGTTPIDITLKGIIVDGTLDSDPIWKIVKILSVKPGNLQMLYKIQVRQ